MFGLCSYAYRCGLFGTAVFTGGCYLSPAAAGSKWKELAACFVLYLVIVLPEFFIYAAYPAGKARNRDTPLFTIPSFPLQQPRQ